MKYFFLTLCISLTFVSSASAATIITTTPVQVNTGERFAVDIAIDTEGETVNVISMDIVFPSAFLRFSGYDSTQTIIPQWFPEPKESTKGIVHFSGIIPGGVERLYDPQHPNNRAIPLTRLYFTALAPGNATLAPGSVRVLKNDGEGTDIPTTAVSKQITIGTGPVDTSTNVDDTTSPLPFTITLTEGSLFGRTPRLALFEARDLESGIERYEIKIGTGSWRIVQSPYPLPHRLFSYTVAVRAFDFSGNYTEQQVLVQTRNPYSLGFAILFGIVAIVFYRYSTSRKRRIINDETHTN